MLGLVCILPILVSNRLESKMGYKVLGKTEDIYRGYTARKGLEGPFVFAGGRILYYDPRAGQYWDPTTDFYVEHHEVIDLQNKLFGALR